MKHTLSLLVIVSVACASVARAGDVTVKAVMTTGPADEPVTSFAANTPKLFALFKTKGVQSGDKLRSVWIAEDVGDAAAKETKIDEKTLSAEGDTDDGVFSLSKPTKGWPVGKYRVEIYVNDELATTVKFKIHAPISKKDAADGEEDESSDE